jgi:hypothetical protein
VNFLLELASRRAEGLSAVGAGTNAAKMVVAEDAGSVAVGKCDLNGVVANRRGRLRAELRLKHRERGGGSGAHARASALSYPFIIARGARALVAKVREIVVTRVTVRPGNVDPGAAGDVNFYAGRLFSRIDWQGHLCRERQSLRWPLQQSPGGIGFPCGHVFGWPRKLQMR